MTQPIFSSERILHKDYDRKCSVAKRFGTKTNWLAENRQSQSNFDFDYDFGFDFGVN
jgi:hypothetical protein